MQCQGCHQCTFRHGMQWWAFVVQAFGASNVATHFSSLQMGLSASCERGGEFIMLSYMILGSMYAFVCLFYPSCHNCSRFRVSKKLTTLSCDATKHHLAPTKLQVPPSIHRDLEPPRQLLIVRLESSRPGSLFGYYWMTALAIYWRVEVFLQCMTTS
jgi:hypothetical protein